MKKLSKKIKEILERKRLESTQAFKDFEKFKAFLCEKSKYELVGIIEGMVISGQIKIKK